MLVGKTVDHHLVLVIHGAGGLHGGKRSLPGAAQRFTPLDGALYAGHIVTTAGNAELILLAMVAIEPLEKP